MVELFYARRAQKTSAARLAWDDCDVTIFVLLPSGKNAYGADTHAAHSIVGSGQTNLPIIIIASQVTPVCMHLPSVNISTNCVAA